MRLLDTWTGQFVEGVDPETKDWKSDPEWVYAILSHTWDKKGEQTYEQLKKIQQRNAAAPEPQASQDRPCRPENISSSSPEQDRGGPSPTSPPSQPPHDSPSATSLLAPSAPPESESSFAHKMARLRMWCRRRSTRNPLQLPSANYPVLATRPPRAVGHFTQSEVEGLFHEFVEVYGLATKPPQPESFWDDPDLSPKIQDACKVVRRHGYRYIWIDSCCIDQSSSSELSEAINSMYKWYRLADVCYVYLADVPPGADHHAKGSAFRKSRWFTRGWTLQELIAPGRVEFLSQDWTPIGSKNTLVNLVQSVTDISAQALLRLKPLEEFSVAQRFSWATKRETTRVEDRAYSLLGIFDINMPTLYGEGDRAFRRLQEQIMQRIPDQSIFAWGRVYLPSSQLPSDPTPAPKPTIFTLYKWKESPLANSPDAFTSSINLRHLPWSTSSNHHEIECTFTPYGIRVQFEMIPLTSVLLSAIFPYCEVQLELPGDPLWYLAILSDCEHNERPGYGLGRICYTRPSKSSVNYVHNGYVEFRLLQEFTSRPDLILLPPEIIEQFRPHTELKTVYISHPQSDCTDSDPFRSLREQQYTAIKLVLLTGTGDAVRSRGYTVDLRDPDPDHPTTQWLTISNEHTITVKFQHTLEYGGRRFTIDAEVEMLGYPDQPHSATRDSDQVARHTVSWVDSWFPWTTKLGPQTVKLSAGRAGTLTLGLSLDFAGDGFYFVCVDLQSDAPSAEPIPPGTALSSPLACRPAADPRT